MLCQKSVINVAEQTVRGLVKAMGPEGFFIGLHNAFAYGDILKDCGIDFDDDQLEEMFDYFDGLNKIAKKIG